MLTRLGGCGKLRLVLKGLNQRRRPVFLRAGWFWGVRWVCLLSAWGASVVCGCASEPAAAPGVLVVAAPAEAVWELCQRELKGRGFALDRVDRRTGLILSQPRTSSQWFELGCQDVVTAEDLAESSLHTVRRIVTMTVAPGEGEGGGCCQVRCRVEVERLWAPPDLVAGRVRARELFGVSAGRLPGLRPEVNRESRWLALGQDHHLQAAILEGLRRHLERRQAS